MEIIIYPEKEGYIAKLYDTNGGSRLIIDNALPLEYAQGVAEDYARRNLKIAFANANAEWMCENVPATTSQRNYLEKLNAWQDGITKAQAAIEIRKIVAYKNKQRRAMANEPITDKQRYFLSSYGINTENMSKISAMIEIAKLKQKVS